jgi:hypothetical protein
MKAPENVPVRLDQPFFNMQQAWLIKGSCCSWYTFQHDRFFQPKGGRFDGKFGGKGVFTNETILEWIKLTDEDLPSYHSKYMTGAKPRTPSKKRIRA